MDKAPLILLTNDDGVKAPGLAALDRAMKRVGQTWICAPEREQSAQSHAITVSNRDLRLTRTNREGHSDVYAVGGTPADCVKLALTHLLEGRVPDLVISGINRGRNTGVNILYSGTVAAAAEGRISGIPAMAVSLACEIGDLRASYETAALYAERLARIILKEGLPEGVVLNVNVPNLPLEHIRGAVVTRMSHTMYIDKFAPVHGRDGSGWVRNIGEELVLDCSHADNDDTAIEEGKVSITPLQFDLTCHTMRETIKAWAEAINVK
ncbi:MAG: 5'/3'-nucleotidase SurE [Candidatus Sumerlaeota bacterium]|nr:5'/3'-nucleotidase SurE [Candidatus Sumerlaeota bacterium]